MSADLKTPVNAVADDGVKLSSSIDHRKEKIDSEKHGDIEVNGAKLHTAKHDAAGIALVNQGTPGTGTAVRTDSLITATFRKHNPDYWRTKNYDTGRVLELLFV